MRPQSASLASQGPALLASGNAEALNERTQKMKETQQVALAKLGEIIELGADKAVVSALSETVKNIDDTIKSLGSAARERLETAALHDKQFDALRTAQASFVAAANPAMMDAQAQINAILQSANLLARRRDRGGTARRPARQRHRQQQSDGIQHGGGTVGQQQRHARSDREGIQGRASERQINARIAPRHALDQGVARRRAEIAGAGRGQGGCFQDPSEGT